METTGSVPAREPYDPILDRYLSLGWKLLPVEPGGKRANLSNWPKQASKEPVKVARWWKNTPNSNVGVLCGKPSDLCVLDIDQHGPTADGTKALRILRDLGRIPETPISETAGGGFHYFFAHPAGDELKKCTGLLPGVDFISKGAYAVLPPSTRNGKAYRWKVELSVPLAPLPEWLLALATMHRDARGVLEAALLANGIRKGERNTQLASLAGKLWNLPQVKTAAELESHLQAANLLLCAPELEREQVSTIAHSISGYEKHEPRERHTSMVPAPLPVADDSSEPEEQDAPRVRFLDLADYERNGIPPVPWIADGWLAEGDIALLAGAAGAGKSTLAAWIAQHLARGKAWCGVPVNLAVPVLYVDEEQGPHTTARLFLRTGGPNSNLAVCQGQGIRLDTDEGRQLLEQAIQGHPSGGVPVVVFLDTAQQLFGFADENNATAVGEMFRYLFGLRNRYECAFVLLHHKRKDNPNHKSGLLELVRGSTAFGTQADTVWFATLGADGLALRQVKRRDGDLTSLQISLETDPTGTIHLAGHGPAESLAKNVTEERAAEVLEHLQKNGPTRFGQLKIALGMKDYEVNRATKKLQAEGLAKQEAKGAPWQACGQDS